MENHQKGGAEGANNQAKVEGKQKDNKIKVREFKHFDIIVSAVDDENNKKKQKKNRSFKDHHYASTNSSPNKQKKYYNGQTDERIMKEWEILEKGLPDSIYVRVYKERIDLLRAVIIGPPGTPYHNGLFFFDFQFPSDYPNRPPKFHYHPTFGFQFPHLWAHFNLLVVLFGQDNQKWDPEKSNVLKILLMIKKYVLCPKPYYNTALGYIGKGPTYLRGNGPPFFVGECKIEWPFNWIHEERYALAYNREAFDITCRTAMKLLAKPPSHFEEFVAQHFRDHAESILNTFKSCINGGVYFGEGEDKTQYSPTSSAAMADSIAAAAKLYPNNYFLDIYPYLVKAFVKNGSSLRSYVKDCNERYDLWVQMSSCFGFCS